MVHQNIRKPSCTCRYMYKTDSFNMAHPPRTCWEVLWWGRSKWQSRPQILQGSWVCRAASRGRYDPTPRPGRYVGDGPGYEDHPLVWCSQLPSGHSVHLKEDLTIHDIIIVQNNKLTVLHVALTPNASAVDLHSWVPLIFRAEVSMLLTAVYLNIWDRSKLNGEKLHVHFYHYKHWS